MVRQTDTDTDQMPNDRPETETSLASLGQPHTPSNILFHRTTLITTPHTQIRIQTNGNLEL